MTIAEAERRYSVSVKNLRKQHELYTKRTLIIWDVIGAILMMIGIILIIIGYTISPVSDVSFLSMDVFWVRILGILLLCLVVLLILLITVPCLHDLKKGPNFLAQTKNLYFNYLKCVDMNDSDKEFYKEKIEEIRHMELVNAIHSSAAATSAAILFTTLNK